MILAYRTRTEIQRTVIRIRCDICGKSYSADAEPFEFQEFHQIRFEGGFGSVFGDGTRVECDVCQHCMKAMLNGRYRERQED